MTVGIVGAGFFMKDPPKNWWPKDIDPLNWRKHSTRDLRNNSLALRHYNLGQMWRTPQAKWIGIQYALYIGCSLFGVAYYYGETNNAINYGSIYAFKALGGSFAGGVAALIMTGTLYGNPNFHWVRGFYFGAALGALAALTVTFFCKPPTEQQMAAAVRRSEEQEEARAKPAIA